MSPYAWKTVFNSKEAPYIWIPTKIFENVMEVLADLYNNQRRTIFTTISKINEQEYQA